MIIQQVNLYQEDLKSGQLNADIFIYLSVIIVFLLSLTGISLYFQHQLHKNEDAVALAQKNLNSQKTIVKQLQDNQPPVQDDAALLLETKQWQKKVANLEQTIAMLDNKNTMQSQGFSGYFLALANQSVSSIWLNTLYFEAEQELINLEGSTFKPDEIGFFLQRLQKEPVFHGRSFAKLAIFKSPSSSELIHFKLSTHLPVLKKNHVE